MWIMVGKKTYNTEAYCCLEYDRKSGELAFYRLGNDAKDVAVMTTIPERSRKLAYDVMWKKLKDEFALIERDEKSLWLNKRHVKLVETSTKGKSGRISVIVEYVNGYRETVLENITTQEYALLLLRGWRKEFENGDILVIPENPSRRGRKSKIESVVGYSL